MKKGSDIALIDVLQREIQREHEEEVIGGTSIADALDAVDLSIAHTPVICVRGEPESQAANVIGRTHGGDYFVDHPLYQSTPVSPDVLRVMRARYLLTMNERRARQYAPLVAKLRSNVE